MTVLAQRGVGTGHDAAESEVESIAASLVEADR